MFKLAGMFVDIEARDAAFRKSIGSLRGELSAIGVAIGTAAGDLAASAIARATSAIAGFFAKGISGAANLGESLSKVDAVFGGSAATITRAADSLAKAYGLPRQAILDAGASIGLVAKAAGQSQSAAADMGAQMARLAADASSFYNVPLEEALGKIRSGLVGESEPLRAFGVLLSEEAVAAEAVAMGLARSTRDVDQQAKVMARASLITRGLADAQGDLERTSGSTANQWRKLTGSLENTAVAIGQSLSPAIEAIVSGLTSTATAIGDWVESSKARIQSFAEAVTRAFKVDVPNAWDTFIAGLAVASFKVEEWGANTMAVLAVVPENLSRIARYVAGNWRALIVDAVNAVGAAFRNLGENLYRLGAEIVKFLSDPTKGFHLEWKPLLDGFRATADALPEMLRPSLVSMDAQIAAVGADLERKTEARAKAATAAAQAARAAPARALAAAAGAKEKEFKSEISGSAEFALKLRGGIFEHRDDAQKKTAEHTKTLVEINREIREMLRKKRPAALA